MNILFLTLLFLIGASLQTVIPPVSGFGSLTPPILLSLLIYTSLHATRRRTLYAALLAGILHDAFCPVPFGVSIPFYILIVYGLFAIRQEIFADQIVTYALLGLAAVSLKTLYFALIFSAGGIRPVWPAMLGMQLLGSLLFGAFLAPVVYLIVANLKRLRPAGKRVVIR